MKSFLFLILSNGNFFKWIEISIKFAILEVEDKLLPWRSHYRSLVSTNTINPHTNNAFLFVRGLTLRRLATVTNKTLGLSVRQ